jgi:REP element-mobilizing transposase RayT
MLRGNGGQTVFETDEDRYRFYLLLQEGICRFGYRVHAFCLMSNHIHLAVQVGEIPLSRAIQNLSFRFTRWINWRQRRTGHLFQGRYKAILVDGDSYLLELVRYIHLNPIRVGMAKSPEEYSWSSHRAYLCREQLPWLTTDWVLGQFGKSVAKARSSYRSFVMDGLMEEHRPEFHGGKDDSRMLGEDSFVERCLALSEVVPRKVTVQELVAGVCREYGMNEAQLSLPSQQRAASEARAAMGLLAQEVGGITLSDVARLCKRDVGTISSSVSRLRERMGSNPELAGRIVALKSALGKTT